MKIIIFSLLYIKTFLLIIYAKYEIFHVDDSIDYIISSEGISKTLNPIYSSWDNPSYTFKFNDILHNLKEPLCLHFFNCCRPGHFAFKKVYINEYDITIINYEDFYYCNECNLDTEKKFKINTETYNGSPIISYSYVNKETYFNFCLYSTSDISIFYIDESKINQKFYTGKIVEYALNNEINYFNINTTFVKNGNEDYIFDLNTVSFKIVNITNKKGKLFNDKEELFEDSFFNAKNNYLIYKRGENEGDEGYLMIIYMSTKPRNQNKINISTCEKEAKIFLYISQKNCTMNNISKNYCQKCISGYGKYENKCYHKSEKLDDLYYNDKTEIFTKCEKNKNTYTCSICPKGTYRDSISNICHRFFN